MTDASIIFWITNEINTATINININGSKNWFKKILIIENFFVFLISLKP